MNTLDTSNPPGTSGEAGNGDLSQTILAGVLPTPATLEKQATCDHNWERDGQTMTAVRWTCTKCFKTELL